MGMVLRPGFSDRFAGFMGALATVVGHPRRGRPLRDYCTGLLATPGRRSVEPMAAVTDPAEVSAQHQRRLHFVGESDWLDERMLAKVRELVLPAIERHGPIEAWIIDDTSFPKKGSDSVGVHHQYCGQLGKQANCQVVVTLSIANHHASLPIAYRLYLPQAWSDDTRRRAKAHVPAKIKFKTKPKIALEQIRAAHAAGVPRGVVLIDASYGSNKALRDGITALGLTYAAAIVPSVKVRRVGPHEEQEPRLSVRDLALSLPRSAWHKITWREGTNEQLCSRFARLRVRLAPLRGATKCAEETLLVEWPAGEAAPTKYWLVTVDPTLPFDALVDIVKMRWHIERDYHDLKQELGLGHYEGRGWRGFHHHGTLCIAAYGFLLLERDTIPPSAPHSTPWLEKPALPKGYRPRGAPDEASASRPELDCHDPPQAGCCDRADLATMPTLRTQVSAQFPQKLMTQ